MDAIYCNKKAKVTILTVISDALIDFYIDACFSLLLSLPSRGCLFPSACMFDSGLHTERYIALTCLYHSKSHPDITTAEPSNPWFSVREGRRRRTYEDI